MRLISKHGDLDEAIVGVRCAARDAQEMEYVSPSLRQAGSHAYFSTSRALAYLVAPGDGDGQTSFEVTQMTLPELLRVPAVASDVDMALTALTSPGQPLGLKPWHENLLIEVSMAQVEHAQAQVATKTGKPVGVETDAILVERYLQEQIDMARREMTRLAMSRADHMDLLLARRRGRHGAKAEVARLLEISPQSVQDATAANYQRWAAARSHRTSSGDDADVTR